METNQTKTPTEYPNKYAQCIHGIGGPHQHGKGFCDGPWRNHYVEGSDGNLYSVYADFDGEDEDDY